MSTVVGTKSLVIPQTIYNTNPADFNNWTNGAGNGGDPFSKTISGDGSSVTITRNTPNSGINGRFYIEIGFGPWANLGDVIAVRMQVTAFDGGGGTTSEHIYLQTASLSALSGDAVRKKVTGVGHVGLMAQTTVANLLSATLRVGVGTFANDASTNSITISNVQVTRGYIGQTKPDPLVSYKYLRDAFNTITGDVVAASAMTYNATTGAITAESATMATGKQSNIILAMGDSFFASSGSSYGGMLYRLQRYYKSLIVYGNATGGRDLLAMSNVATFLGPLWAESGANRASALLVTGGINDIISGGKTAANLISYDQLIYDWCVSKGITYVKFGVAPFGAHASWTSGLQAIADSYNAQLAANPFGANFRFVPIYTALEDATTADYLATAYNGGDGLHPSYASSYSTSAGVDVMIREMVNVLATVGVGSASGAMIDGMIN